MAAARRSACRLCRPWPRVAALAAAAVALTVAVGAGGCDTSIDAFEEDAGRAYSVFGYLDVNADTQFVRVEPLQDSVFAGGARPLEARITTENLGTGETIVWQDSVFALGARGGVSVRNAWTEASLEAGATYRFTVERLRDGAESTAATVALPPAFPVPEVERAPDLTDPRGATMLRVRGVEHLGGVRADYEYTACVSTPAGLECYRAAAAVSHLADTVRQGPGAYTIRVPWQEDVPLNPDASLRTLHRFRVTVASASADWPEYGGADSLAVGSIPDGVALPPPSIDSNVEGGAGFLGGAFTHTVEVPVTQ